MGELNPEQLQRLLDHPSFSETGITEADTPRVVIAQQLGHDLARAGGAPEDIDKYLAPRQTHLDSGHVETAHSGRIPVHTLRDPELLRIPLMKPL